MTWILSRFLYPLSTFKIHICQSIILSYTVSNVLQEICFLNFLKPQLILVSLIDNFSLQKLVVPRKVMLPQVCGVVVVLRNWTWEGIPSLKNIWEGFTKSRRDLWFSKDSTAIYWVCLYLQPVPVEKCVEFSHLRFMFKWDSQDKWGIHATLRFSANTGLQSGLLLSCFTISFFTVKLLWS